MKKNIMSYIFLVMDLFVLVWNIYDIVKIVRGWLAQPTKVNDL